MQVLSLATHKYGSNILEKCFKNASPGLKKELIETIVNKVSVEGDTQFSMMKLIRDQYGNFVVQKVIDESDEELRKVFIQKIITVAP